MEGRAATACSCGSVAGSVRDQDLVRCVVCMRHVWKRRRRRERPGFRSLHAKQRHFGLQFVPLFAFDVGHAERGWFCRLLVVSLF
jgi:hypothetical protein